MPTRLIEHELARGEVLERLAVGVGRFEADAGWVLCCPAHPASLPALLAFRGRLREAAQEGAARRRDGVAAGRSASPERDRPARR